MNYSQIFIVNNLFNIELIQANKNLIKEGNVYILLADESLKKRKQFISEKLSIEVKNIIFINQEIYTRNIIRSISYNFNFRKSLKSYLDRADHVVVFNNHKPYVRYLLHYSKIRDFKVELWEEGLNHYLELNNNFEFKIISMLKLFFLSYTLPIRFKNYHEFDLIRDRFKHKNLKYDLFKPEIDSDSEEIIFIGQPLVKDGILRESEFYDILTLISKNFEGKVKYVLHPREEFNNELRKKGIEQVKLDESVEVFLRKKKFLAYFSFFSTATFNIEHPNNFCLIDLIKIASSESINFMGHVSFVRDRVALKNLLINLSSESQTFNTIS